MQDSRNRLKKQKAERSQSRTMRLLGIKLVFILCIVCFHQISCDFNETELMNVVKQNWFAKTFATNFSSPTVGFYHIYGEGGHFKAIVAEQFRQMRQTGLLDKMDVVYYTTTGSSKIDSMEIHSESKFKHLHHFYRDGEEVYTLGLMYRFCQKYPTSKVLYFHDKGSFHPTPSNEIFRRFLNCFVLNPHCISTLETGLYDTCGWRATPTPHPHYPGNFFWATCQYINTLVDPWSPKSNATFVALTAQLSNCIGSAERYFAETWVTSAPKVRPADCMSSDLDSSFLYGYKFPTHVLGNNCPGSNGQFGAACGNASTLINADRFKDSFAYMKHLDGCHGDLDDELIKRSMFWYGQRPESLLKWIAPMKPEYVNFPEGTAIRPASERQVYIMKGGELRGIPDGRTFKALGLSWGNIVVIPDILKPRYKIGEMMPSQRKRRRVRA